mgnify:CR=1 FL=1
MIWDKYVALKLLPFAILGVCLSEFVFVSYHLSSFWLIGGILLLLFLRQLKYRWTKRAYALITLALIVMLGFSRQSKRHDQKSDLPIFTESTASLVRVVSSAEQKANSTAYDVRILWVFKDSLWRDVNHKSLLYVGLDSMKEEFRYGDMLYIQGAWSEIQEPLNPNSFDFRKYMARKGVFLSQFQYPSRIHRIDSGYVHPVIARVHEFRAFFEQTLRDHGFEGDEYGVAKAVITGDKTHVTSDLLEKYSASGSMHVLAVSGLHVGIIYLIFFYLFKPLTHVRHGTIIRLVLLVLLLWFYALFTGMSASVVRASTMFTAVAFAQSVKRITNIYNTIALSALVLLLLKPGLLFEVGFQLSYSAVIGIVSFQPIFSSWWTPKSKVVKWLYDLICVSIAAQLATFPIALGVFNQFPNLFLLSNLWVIPMITIVLYIGVTLIILHTLLPIPSFLFDLWRWIIEWMNRGVDWIEAIPFSSTDSLWISKPEIFGVYGLIIGLFFLLKSGKSSALVWLMSGFLVLFGYRHFQSEPRDELVFYSLRDGFAMDVWNGEERMFLYTDSIYHADSYAFHIRGNHLSTEDRITPIHLDAIDSLHRQGLYFRDHILVGPKSIVQWWRGKALGIAMDYTIIDQKSGYIDLDECDLDSWGTVILSSQLSRGKANWLEKQLTERGVEVVNLARGYFAVAFN